MTGFDEFLSSVQQIFPQILIGLCLLALAGIVWVVLGTSSSLKQAAKAKKPPAASDASLPSPTPASDKMPPPWGRLGEFLSRKGYVRVGELSLTFLKALEILKEHLNSADFKYKLPWYLLVGPEGSGKSSLMEGADLLYPLGCPPSSDSASLSLSEQQHSGIQWRFLNGGVVLDVSGRLFLANNKEDRSEHKNWNTLLNLLNRYRTRRPIEGILLTISLSEFYGAQKLPLHELQENAQGVAQKLHYTQKVLGLQLPIYVVLTKGDVLPGFQNLCQALPPAHRHNLLGWSCPYQLSVAFGPEWIQEALASLRNQLLHLRTELLAHGVSELSRDGIFILPGELSHLAEPLTLYLGTIFHAHSYEQGFSLRGIYLTGDGGLPSLPVHSSLLSSSPVPHDLIAKDGTPVLTMPGLNTQGSQMELSPGRSLSPSHRIFFFQDLLTEKVFPEKGLCHPLPGRLLSRHQSLFYAKISILGMMGVGGVGLIRAYDHLISTRQALLPALARVNTTLAQLPQSRLEDSLMSSPAIDTQARQLMDMMNTIEQAHFFSFFIPNSWFSPVHTHLKQGLRVAFNQIILRAIHGHLSLKAKHLLLLRPKKKFKSSLALQMHPASTPEFKLLQGYVEGFFTLLHHISQYNALGNSSDPQLIQELTQYTLGVALPKEFIENYTHFQKTLQETTYPRIDLLPHQGKAQETLSLLYSHFITSLLSPLDPLSILGRLHTLFQECLGGADGPLPTRLNALRALAQDLETATKILGKPGDTWMDKKYFNPSTEFSDLMHRVSSCPLFGPSLLNELATQTALLFGRFQKEMVQLIEKMNTSSLTPSLNPPSLGLTSLAPSLSLLFSQSFMMPSFSERIVFRIPENHVVFWNAKLIETAVDEIKKYQTFFDQHKGDLPPALRGPLAHLARSCLQQTLVSLVARAQTLTPIDQGESRLATAENLLVHKIKDVREISPQFIHLLEAMSEGGMGIGFVELRTLLGTLSFRLLSQVDELLQGGHFYEVRGGHLSSWQGSDSPVLKGFNLKDSQDLKEFLERQQHRISHLAGYAEPMVLFLSSPIMQDFEMDRTLLMKWHRLIGELKAYEVKDPNSTLLDLENSFLKDLMTLSLKKCFIALPLKELKHNTGDFFHDRLLHFKREILSQCEILRRKKSLSFYQKLQTLFTQTLAGKFPFVGPNEKGREEASFSHIREFFKIYKKAGDHPKAILDQVYQLGEEARPLLEFLESMEKVKEFFQHSLSEKNNDDPPFFDVKMTFRSNRTQEKYGNVIIEWGAKMGGTTLTNHDKNPIGRWKGGDPLSLNLRWATSAERSPYPDPQQSNILSVSGKTATFSYSGEWALLRFIQGQKAPSSEYDPVTNPLPYVLKFTIPNGPKETTFVYVTASLFPNAQKSLHSPLIIPSFPSEAPVMTEEILERESTPVLVHRGLGEESDTESEEDASEQERKTDEELKIDESSEGPTTQENSASLKVSSPLKGSPLRRQSLG